MVTLTVALATPIPQSELIRVLEVYLDAERATPREEADALASGAAKAGPSAGSSTIEPARRDKFGVTLMVEAPYSLESSADVTLSVYSALDRREIASTTVEYLAYPEAEKFRAFVDDPRARAIGVFAVAALFVAAILVQVFRRRSQQQIRQLEYTVQVERQRVSELGRVGANEAGSTAPGEETSPPELPHEVLAALERREMVLVLGPGTSAQSGLPTSRSLWLDVLDRCSDGIPEAQRQALRAKIASEGADSAIEPILYLVGRDKVLAALRAELIGSGARPARLHELLARLPVPAVVDTNWDDLMARALDGREVQTFGPARPDGISQALRAGKLALLKPMGDLQLPEGVVLTEREYRLMLARAPELERSIAALFSTRTLLFLGFSLHGLEQFLIRLPAQLESEDRRHFAVVPAGAGQDLWAAGLGQRFGVTLLPYRPSPDYHELVTAVDTLAGHGPTASGKTGTGGAGLALRNSRLTSLKLESIGLFRSLELELTPGWTLLLGDNGGGKSTILRAVALALAGNDPRAVSAAQQLLRSGADAGTIELGIGTTRIMTNLVRDQQAVLVRSPQTTALQAGQLLVLAFPALRGVTTTQVRGPTQMAAPDPSVDDVAPLLAGVVDTRLDNLQQWVVNTALRAEKEPNGRAAKMFRTFRTLVQDMVPGGGLEYSRVDPKTWQVMVKTGSIEVPFASVSQGMSSILNWIGVLLERLYDVYPHSESPEHEPAIVLIDEIDAHLHPRWQRQLVTLTRENFPNVQIIASSHSPLLAGAVAHAELRVVAPNEDTGEMEARVPPEDVSGQKAEDILVSSVFSLETTRSVEAEQTIERYFELYEKGSLSDDEQSELQRLSGQLRLLNYGPTVAERQSMNEIRVQIDHDLGAVSREAVEMLQARLGAAPASEARPVAPSQSEAAPAAPSESEAPPDARTEEAET